VKLVSACLSPAPPGNTGVSALSNADVFGDGSMCSVDKATGKPLELDQLRFSSRITSFSRFI
jgi:hypothetical protein